MKKLHYFMGYGQIVIRLKDQPDEAPQMVPANALITVDGVRLMKHADIAKMQQGIQISAMNKLTGNDAEIAANIQIIDTLIASVFYLGHMTEREFNAVPVGMAMQEAGLA